MSKVLGNTPIRNFLKERETLIPRPKIVGLVGERLLGQVELPAGVAPEQAIEVISRSDWARNLAAGVCGAAYVGLTPGTPEYEKCVFNVSHRVAAKVLGLTWVPPVAPPPRPRRR